MITLCDMRIPYEKRVDRYEVEWRKVDGGDGKTFSYATLTIHELWSIGHLLFKEPLAIEVFFGEEDKTNDRALVIYDFGMEDDIPLKKEHNFLHDYAGDNKECEPIKTVFASVKFDLMHAFFHYKGDPNYNHTHWALLGNLKDKVTADDSYIFDDIEYEEAKKKCPFKVGDRVRTKSIISMVSTGADYNPHTSVSYGPIATVVVVHDKGFDWKLDEKQTLIAREGSWYQEGTCFPNGYATYELVPNPEDKETPEAQAHWDEYFQDKDSTY